MQQGFHVQAPGIQQKTVCPKKNRKKGIVSGTVEYALGADQRAEQRKTHKTAVRVDRGKAEDAALFRAGNGFFIEQQMGDCDADDVYCCCQQSDQQQIVEHQGIKVDLKG